MEPTTTDAVVSTEAPATAPVADTAQTTPPSAERSEGLQQEPQAPRTFTRAEVDRIVSRQLNKAEARWERRHKDLLETALTSRQSVEPPTATDSEAPDPTKFTDPAAYLRALTRYETQQAIREAQSSSSRQAKETEARERAVTMAAKAQQQHSRGMDKYEDFDEVVARDDLPISPAMAEVMFDSDIGDEIAYYLGKNQAEAERISRLSPARAAAEIGKIEDRLATKAKAPTSAPTPPTPVGGTAKGQKDPEDMSDAEFAAWRQKQIAARRGR